MDSKYHANDHETCEHVVKNSTGFDTKARPTDIV